MVKRLAGRLLGEPLWSFMSWHRDRFGAAQTFLALARSVGGQGNVRVLTTFGPVWIRPGTMDLEVCRQLLIDRVPELPKLSPRFIIDAGAHIGCASVLFSTQYPGATIAAVEPTPDNFRVLERNSARRPEIHPVNAALWSHETTLRLQNPDAATWSFRMEEANDGIPTVTVEGLMRRFGFDRVDILKMDVEGAETQILNHGADWLDRVGCLMIELHERYSPGCTAALSRAVAGRNIRVIEWA
jgi:FkbM family methyltransferase